MIVRQMVSEARQMAARAFVRSLRESFSQLRNEDIENIVFDDDELAMLEDLGRSCTDTADPTAAAASSISSAGGQSDADKSHLDAKDRDEMKRFQSLLKASVKG